MDLKYKMVCNEKNLLYFPVLQLSIPHTHIYEAMFYLCLYIILVTTNK